MKSYFKITIILLLAVFITIFVSPLIAGLVSFPLHRIMSRVILIVLFVAFFHYKDWLGFNSIKELGLNFDKKWFLMLVIGFLLALFSICIILVIMLQRNIRFVISDLHTINWFKYLAGYLLAGLLVGLAEECLFRGFLLQSLLKDTNMVISVSATSIFYSFVHFLKPSSEINPGRLSLITSINTVNSFFYNISEKFSDIWPSMIGLFLVGVVLSVVCIRMGTLAVSIGMHAGWIIGIKSISLATDVTSKGSLWVNGVVLGNPFTWMVLTAIIFLFIIPRKNKDTRRNGFKKVVNKI